MSLSLLLPQVENYYILIKLRGSLKSITCLSITIYLANCKLEHIKLGILGSKYKKKCRETDLKFMKCVIAYPNRFACLLVIIIRKCKVENIKKGERDAVKLFIMAVGYTYLLVST